VARLRLHTTPADFAVARGRLAEQLEARGRSGAGFPNAVATMWTWVSEDAVEVDRVLREVLAPLLRRDADELAAKVCIGSSGHCAELLGRYEAAECDRVFIWPLGDERRQLEAFAERVITT
jgi:hypothetical protein